MNESATSKLTVRVTANGTSSPSPPAGYDHATCEDGTTPACYSGLNARMTDFEDITITYYLTTTPVRIISVVLSPSQATAKALEAAAETSTVVSSSLTGLTPTSMAPNPMPAPFPKRDETESSAEVSVTLKMTLIASVGGNDEMIMTGAARNVVGDIEESLYVSTTTLVSAMDQAPEVKASTVTSDVFATVPSTAVPTTTSTMEEPHIITMIPYPETSALATTMPTFSVVPCRPHPSEDPITRPIYRAAMLGNAYGGGYITPPSLCVSFPPELDSGVAPGYGRYDFGPATATAVYSSKDPAEGPGVSETSSTSSTSDPGNSSGGVYGPLASGGIGAKLEVAMDAAAAAILILMVFL